MTTNAVPAHEQSEATVNQALHLFKIPQTDVSACGIVGINSMEFLIYALDDCLDDCVDLITMEPSLQKNPLARRCPVSHPKGT